MVSLAALANAVATGARAALRRTIVTALEPTTGPWVNQNAFGDQRFAPLPVTAGQVISILPKNTQLYGPPTVHSVCLGRSDDVEAQNADVYARITFGCGGVENSFDCDWLHGVQFSLVCNSISVQAVTYAPTSSAYAASNAHVALKASVSKGSVSQGRCPATFTHNTLRLAETGLPGAAVEYSIPDYARELTVHMIGNNNPATANGVTISFQNEGGTQLAQYGGQVFAGGRSVPIPGGCNNIRIENTTANQVQTTAQFFLGL
jgi:hypothetical protein